MKKILVRTPQWLGDAIVSTIFLDRLKLKFPQAEIDVLTPANLVPLFEPHSAVHSVIPLAYGTGGNIFDVARSLQGKSYEGVYVLPRSFRTALEAWLSKIPKRIGYSGDGRRLLLTDVFKYDEAAAYPHRYLKLIADDHLSLEGLRPFFPKANVSELEISGLIGTDFSKLPKPFFGMAPASVAPARTWPADRFADVAKRFLQEKGGTVFLFGSQKETATTKKILELVPEKVVDTAGKLNLPQLGWLFNQLDVFLGNDSGLMHAVSAFDIPSVILFGASNPRWALPQTGNFRSLQHKEIFCVPCLRNHCVRLGTDYLACQKALGTEEVWTAIHSMMK